MKYIIATLLMLVFSTQAHASEAMRNCIKINGSKVTVLGQACFDRYSKVRNMAHIARANGGSNPVTAIRQAESMNRRNITFVVGARCDSSCWITWNFMKRKCWYSEHGQRPTFRQHRKMLNGQPVKAHSKSRKYWLAAGRVGPDPDSGWIEWKPPASMRCSERVANMRSTDGNASSVNADREFGLFGPDLVCGRNPHCQRRMRLKTPTPSLFQ